ncbi:hypothetical protein FHS55_001591 [Angulomicrobium tetraedrale]|uniref:Uncharacterized protein n=1 Tax=Ancylobacter tetraedralis TaxID=217068 RepID=A0A839Z8F8_9HYPH|nr:hypothetical protein [Ancylobacter tetraedralis]MBB3770996.1 hypothetical protein [Ancylobacter tetraedralis]
MNRRPDPAIFTAVTPAMRELIENVVEDLMLLLDEIDGDPDAEDDDPPEEGDNGIAENGLL